MNRSIKCLGAVVIAAVVAATASGDERMEGGAEVVMPAARFAAPATARAATQVAFDASASAAAGGGALAYGWDLGDGVRARGAKVLHVFARPGTYAVTLTVVDSAGRTSRETKQITVAPAATSTMTAKRENGPVR